MTRSCWRAAHARRLEEAHWQRVDARISRVPGARPVCLRRCREAVRGAQALRERHAGERLP